MAWGTAVGNDRRDRNAARDYPHSLAFQHGKDKLPLHRWRGADVTGALCELALARFYGIPWRGHERGSDRHRGDVGMAQVRGTSLRAGHLILRDDDDGSRPFFLVLRDGDDGDRFRIAGWLYGREGQLPRYRENNRGGGRGGFFVPQSDLREPPDPLAPLIRSRVTALAKMHNHDGRMAHAPSAAL